MAPASNDSSKKDQSDPIHGESAMGIDELHQGFVERLEAHQSMLLRVCWAYTRSIHDRDDLYQEIASRLWGAYPRYDPQRLFSTWMYRVALNVAIDFRRRHSRRSMELLSNEPVEHASPSLQTDRSAQLEELYEQLDRLPEVDRAIIILVLEGYSYRDISEILGIGESNVGSRIHRLKEQLRSATGNNR